MPNSKKTAPKKVQIMDTTLRDAHQSLLATRMRTEDLLPIAEVMDSIGFWSVEVWGGATFDTCLRFLREDPWERLRSLKKAFPKTPLQMLLRGQNVVGYRHYADDVVEKFVEKAIENGMNVIRIFDALNDFRNIKSSVKATIKYGGKVEGCLCYTLGPIYNNEVFVDMAKKLEDMGSDTVCIKDMAGLLAPLDAYDLVLKLKKAVGLPIHLHTHDTSAMSVATTLKAIEAGIDIVDCAASSMAGGTSQPPLETIIHIMRGTPRDTGLDLRLVGQVTEHFKSVRRKYNAFESEYTGIDPNAIIYQVPGGMISNLASQLKEQNALGRMEEVMAEVPRVREDFGFPPLVTPSSQIVGTQATLNILTGERYKVVTSEVKNYLKGLYGKPPAPVNEEIRKKILGDEPVVEVRPADLLEPEIEKARRDAGDKARSEEDVISYALFPKIFAEFAELRDKGFPPEEPKKPLVEAPADAGPTLAPSEFMINVHGESYHVKVGGKGHKSEGKRPYFVWVDNQLVEVLIEALVEVVPSEEGMIAPNVGGQSKRPKPKEPGDVTAPMPGTVIRLKVRAGDKVKAGDTVLIIEAMKMENEVHTPVSGEVKEIYVKEGDSVNPDEALVIVR
ncbi:MAG TPA: sodium-extruding oxaloacetate decarboxylase subunit alpha [Nitrospirota bacterium]|nr:sodium-extruding oxaloacetate decarboxylase subunit alpha [Nitrospirota bacterium]